MMDRHCWSGRGGEERSGEEKGRKAIWDVMEELRKREGRLSGVN